MTMSLLEFEKTKHIILEHVCELYLTFFSLVLSGRLTLLLLFSPKVMFDPLQPHGL